MIKVEFNEVKPTSENSVIISLKKNIRIRFEGLKNNDGGYFVFGKRYQVPEEEFLKWSFSDHFTVVKLNKKKPQKKNDNVENKVDEPENKKGK